MSAASVSIFSASAAAVPVSVLHAAEYIKGGIQTYLCELLPQQLQSFGPGRITAVLPESHCTNLQLPPGIEVVTFDNSGNRIVNALRLAKKVNEAAALHTPQIVHIHSTFAGFTVRPWLAVRRRGARIIYCPHGWAFDREASPSFQRGVRIIEKYLANLCDAIVCISEHEVKAGREIGISSEKLVLVHNGIYSQLPDSPIESAPDWVPGRRRLLFVGRFDRQKGIDVLLDALRELGDEVTACVVGDVAHGGVQIAAMPSNVCRVGWLSPQQLGAYYRSADLMVIPSRWEGFGLVATEAMRAGLVVVASKVGGLPEIVQDGVTGLLVPPGDRQALVAAIRALSDTQLQVMGHAGRARFLKYFTAERMHEQLCALYASQRSMSDGRECVPV